MESSGLSKPLAEKFLLNVQRGAGSRSFSVYTEYKERVFKHERNRHEVEFLARLVDLLRKKQRSAALEVAVRRLVGVETADRSGDWRLCDAFELVTKKQSNAPTEFLAHAIKAVKRIDAVEGKQSNDSSRRGGNVSSGYGGGNSRARFREKQYSNTSGSGSLTGSGPSVRERSTSRGPSRSSESSSKNTMRTESRGKK